LKSLRVLAGVHVLAYIYFIC